MLSVVYIKIPFIKGICDLELILYNLLQWPQIKNILLWSICKIFIFSLIIIESKY